MRETAVVVCLVLSTFSSACGGSPASPTSAQVAGNWEGTVEYTTVFGPFVSPFTMTLTQSGGTVRGTFVWGGSRGSVSGATTTSTFTGTFTFEDSCAGIFDVTGPAGGNSLRWTSPSVRSRCTDMPFGITVAVAAR